jgi:hypothetical protein
VVTEPYRPVLPKEKGAAAFSTAYSGQMEWGFGEKSIFRQA